MEFRNVAIDSMTVACPLSLFDSLPEGLDDILLIINSDTSEIIEEVKKPIISCVNGIKTRAYKVSLFGKEEVHITVNSKMLKTRYLEGMTYDNFRFVFDYLKDVFKFKCSYHDFIHLSRAFDVDFKADFYYQDHDYQEMLRDYSVFAGSKTYYGKKVDMFSVKSLEGLQFVNRKDASIRSPFVKIYDKRSELNNRSFDFYNAYLENQALSILHLKRLEVTVKNKAHFESLKIRDTTLYKLLTLPDGVIEFIIKSCLEKHTGSKDLIKVKGKKQYKIASPTDWLMSKAFLILMQENNMSLQQCLTMVDDYPGLSADTKYKLLKRVKESFLFTHQQTSLRDIKLTSKDAFLE